MSKNLTAKATTSIAATKNRVWVALITPSAIKQYMFDTDVESNWSEGSEIKWKGELKGKKYEDKGFILKIEAEKTLQYSHFSPLSGKPDQPENYHTVTINLSGEGDKTDVALSQGRVEMQRGGLSFSLSDPPLSFGGASLAKA
jgi:uncharacterized protein YndB with AHSA1/START domain